MADDLEACIEFLQELIRTPSLPGEEGAVADLVAARMRALGYDEVAVDGVGNVIGTLRGRGLAPAVVFNTHLDHVDVGDSAVWPFPPYRGEVHEGQVWGRGAVDIKGPLAAQLFGVARLTGGEGPRGDVHVTAVVQEEIGGVGARHLAERLAGQAESGAGQASPLPVIIGEPSRNTVRRGHRGRTEIEVLFTGRSVHASVPEKGLNPLTSLGRFLARLPDVDLREHPELGQSSVAPTLLTTDQTSANVVPAEARLICDWRNVPGETASDARETLERLAQGCCDPGVSAKVSVPVVERRTYTGEVVAIPADNPAYLLAAEHPMVRAVEQIVAGCRADAPGGRVEGSTTAGVDDEAPPDVWQFATDGGHFAARGMAPIGFGPGDELLAHTIDERIGIGELATALDVNERLAAELGARLAGS